eukprot:TRINITY_DN12077_c0_g1_i1.p1 TRINITY_DN12077_c0_g1~~TRINITY_DN12077_c0_g1_i1.p1  ORF type:complete len:833 (+),score=124.05 TRINITY_DN12077_c0_g1_i1:84-2582(+)
MYNIVSWSPHHTQRIIVGSANQLKLIDIYSPLDNIYAIVRRTDDETKKREDNYETMSINHEIRNLKCLDWAPNADNQVAIGLQSGEVLINDMLPESTIVKEFSTQQPRSCTAISWNKRRDHLIATGYSKCKNTASTMIWDVNYIPSSIPGARPDRNLIYPSHEFSNREATVAVNWLPSFEYCLAVGTEDRWLKLYDIRSGNDATRGIQAHKKNVYGLKFDPFDPNLVATFSTQKVKVWDTRKLTDPVFSFNTEFQQLQNIEWCPTRKGLLATHGDHTNEIKVWDLNSIQLRNTATETIMHRNYSWEHNISSISWHPTESMCMMVVGESRNQIKKITLRVALKMSYTSMGTVLIANSNQVMEGNPEIDDFDDYTTKGLRGELDISGTMYTRAKAGYSSDLERNMDLLPMLNSKELYVAWNWMRNTRKLSAGNTESSELKGIINILQSNNTQVIVPDENPKFPIYVSQSRLLCQVLCGWRFYTDERKPWGETIELSAEMIKLQESGEFGRAAALSVFNNCITKATDILSNAPAEGTDQIILTLVGMALSGYDEGSDTDLWKGNSLKASSLLSDPYLEAILCFLSDRTKRFEGVFNSNISLADKIAFACRYLSDELLHEFLTSKIRFVIDTGNLEGLLITGIGNSTSMNLLQNYIDRTGDIQSVSLMLSKLGWKAEHDLRIRKWILTYRELLNEWGLWIERAKFDVHRAGSKQILSQVSARCHGCGKSFTVQDNKSSRRRNRPSRKQNTNTKSIFCPNCSATLPKCSICLQQMQCVPTEPTGISSNQNYGQLPFTDWFTWCQTCKHGGHAQHIKDWFASHTTCPVADCDCNCMSL